MVIQMGKEPFDPRLLVDHHDLLGSKTAENSGLDAEAIKKLCREQQLSLAFFNATQAGEDNNSTVLFEELCSQIYTHVVMGKAASNIALLFGLPLSFIKEVQTRCKTALVNHFDTVSETQLLAEILAQFEAVKTKGFEIACAQVSAASRVAALSVVQSSLMSQANILFKMERLKPPEPVVDEDASVDPGIKVLRALAQTGVKFLVSSEEPEQGEL
jgi:hypothetical protein